MRRRTTITLPDEPPRELTEFNPADWRAEDDHAAFGLWMAARRTSVALTVPHLMPS
jgi:hypothetical protein